MGKVTPRKCGLDAEEIVPSSDKSYDLPHEILRLAT